MQFDDDSLDDIYCKTDGKCHVCGKKLSRVNYGCYGRKGAWHVEHSVPRAKGGTDHLNNLFPACIGCNLDKGTSSTRSARAKHRRTRAPYSREKREKIRQENTIVAGAAGLVIGAAIAGPPGAIIGSLIGGAIGHEVDPEKD